MAFPTKRAAARERPDKSEGNRGQWTALLLLALAFNSQAASAAENDSSADAVPLIPDLELLEFLGSFQTEDGEYINPETMLGDEFLDLLDLAARMDNAMGTTQGDDEDNQQGNQ